MDAQTLPLKILVADDEASIRKTLATCLEGEGYAVTAVSNYEDALAENARRAFDLAFVDLRLGEANGLDLIPGLLAEAPWIKIIVVTAYASIDTAVEAMRRGAADYVPKPFTPPQVRVAARKAAHMRALEQRVENLEHSAAQFDADLDLASANPLMQQAYELARQIAPTEAIALLRGESGTGKSVLARAIHAWSSRAAKPLAIISCPTLSAELLESELFGHVRGAFTGAVQDQPGRIAACEGGTLFLDEIGDLPLSIQPKLLRFLQDREYERLGDHRTRRADVRIIAATNMDLEQAVAERRFREDLYHRLNVIPIPIPPLRERPEDLEHLAGRMLASFSRSNHRVFAGFTPAAIEALRAYAWPGNVRELRNVVERATILCRQEQIDLADLPEHRAGAQAAPRLGDLCPLAQIEEIHIRRVLASTKSLQEAAAVLGIDQATLWRRRKQYGI
ncbi:MAG: sigma-54-dependent Fis family transcriptional regulator [Candidatus Handelsmanbacteria bacterium]|nr:sigma-54-dependent Fis family transcriptional regulator [Candidatus Handelsmanbacteria bacterium]